MFSRAGGDVGVAALGFPGAAGGVPPPTEKCPSLQVLELGWRSLQQREESFEQVCQLSLPTRAPRDKQPYSVAWRREWLIY